MLKRLGVEVEYYDPHVGAGIAALMKPNTKVVFTESPGSNTFEMQDIPAIAKAAHAGGAIVMMDNTWATPLYFRPLDHGVDIIDPCGDEISGRPFRRAARHGLGQRGLLADSFDETLLHAGHAAPARTTSTRCCAACAPWACGSNAIRRARSTSRAGWKARPGVARVLHPGAGKPSRPCPLEARFLRRRAASSRSCSTAAARKQAHAFLDALQIFGLGYSWGGYESLAVPVFLGDRIVAKGPMKAR